MNPRLIVISGNLKGTEFALSEKHVSNIGRETANAVRLNDPSVSRRHCLIERKEDNRFFIRDLGSFNGVFVNGVQIAESLEIKHGDQLGIGDVSMFFLLQDAGEGEALFIGEKQFAVINDETLINQSTIRLPRAEALYLRPEKLLAELPQVARVARDLSVLLKISSVLNSTPETEALQRRLLELIAEIIPAERGAILLVETDEQNDLKIVSNFVLAFKPEKRGSNVQISRTVLERRESVSLLCNDLSQDEELRAAQSLARSSVHSLLCVPLVIFEQTLGIIYVDTSNAATAFDEDHLQLLTGIAGIAAGPLENARRTETLKAENRRLLEQFEGHHEIIGESEKMKDVFKLIAKVAPTDSTVLILGESGTGKELVARAIHRASRRQEKPFVAINCANLSESLLESELFGYEKGAFTGADRTKIGMFEAAQGGTIFLDEIGEFPFALQAKLLRVLQEREMTRLGSVRPIKFDVRLIAATNKDLEEAVKNNAFRQDLFYRLDVFNLEIPPLRERREDIPLLAQFFINKFNAQCNRNVKGVTAQARVYLQKYEWIGNVRELENVIERAVILATGDEIGLDELPVRLVEQRSKFVGAGNLNYQDAVTQAKRIIVEDAIARAGGHINEAAANLQIHPNNLYRLMKTLGIEK
jgi:transcriptional regulator with GAF, ATPase, and Fis domain